MRPCKENITIEKIYYDLINDKTTPVIIIEDAIKRQKKIKDLNAVVSDWSIRALEVAKGLTKNPNIEKNFLYSIPFAIKDNFATKFGLTTCSSNILNNFCANYDATVVKILKDANAIPICKTTLDELALGGDGLYASSGPVFNPWDKTRITGGSSSGSAVLVSTGVVPFALGSDTGDSIRKPASYVGIIGFKPTYGQISRYGLVPYAPSLDTVGYFTNTVNDCIILFNLLTANNDPKDFSSTTFSNKLNVFNNLGDLGSKPKKICVINEVIRALNSETKIKFKTVTDKLTKLGVKIEYIDFGKDLLYALLPTYMTISYAEATSCHSNLTGVNFGNKVNGDSYESTLIKTRSNGFGKVAKRRYVIGSYVLEKNNQKELFVKAKKIRSLISNKVSKLTKEYDAILVPAAPSHAPKISEVLNHKIKVDDMNHIADNILLLANFSGTPSITLPASNINNLPWGINLTAAIGSDINLLKIAKYFETKVLD